jgi:hypothetical protein
MAEGERVGGAYVDVTADLSNFDNAMAALPAKASAKIDAAMKALKAKVAQTKIDFKVALNSGTAADIARIGAEQEKLEAKIASVTRAAVLQAQAMQRAARMNQDGASVLREIHAEAAEQAATSGRAVVGSYARSGSAAKQMGRSAREAGMTGAMGLMVLSQTIDDAQYGFRSIVNNIPQMGMALGSMLGMSLESSMKLGAVAGIAAVGVNLLITHWDKLTKLMGLDSVKTEAEQMEALEKNTARTADETERLNRYKKEQAEIEQMLKGRPSGEKRTADAVQHALDEADPLKVQGTLASHMRPEMTPDQRTEIQRRERDARSMAQSYGAGSDIAKEAVATRDEVARKINESLNAEALSAASKLMARAKHAGPEGDQARQQLKNIVAANPKAFHPDFGRMLDEAAPAKLKPGFASIEEQLRQEEIETGGRENERAYVKRQKDRAKATAGTLEDKVGSGLLSKPGMSDEALERAVREAMEAAGLGEERHGAAGEVARQVREQINEKVRVHGAKTGQSEEQARADLAFEAREKAKHLLDDGARGREAGRLAETMSGGAVGRRLLRDGGQSDEGLQAELRKALEKAGLGAKEIGELLPSVARKLREKVEQDVKARALDRGISEGAARAQLSKEAEKEAREKAIKDAGPKAEVLSDKSYFDKLMVAGFGPTDKDHIPKQALDEAKTTNKTLAKLLKKAEEKTGDGIARVARGPARR